MNAQEENLISKVTYLEINEDVAGQRLDNYLCARLKGVPKSHIYRVVRKGEVRVNKGRVDVSYRLQANDVIRVPPIRVATRSESSFVPETLRQALEQGILYEDEGFLVVNKAAGFAVHGGTGIQSGIIEGLRLIRPEARFLELAHRLDRDTSGCLIIAKKRSALRLLHDVFRQNEISKTYLALLAGCWQRKKQLVDAPLLKNICKGGERIVVISSEGKSAQTLFKRLKLFSHATLVEAAPVTGRTHQIRVHAASMGHPIVGDERYGDTDTNKTFKDKGHKRMFLHAESIRFKHPVTGQLLIISAPLPKQLELLLAHE